MRRLIVVIAWIVSYAVSGQSSESIQESYMDNLNESNVLKEFYLSDAGLFLNGQFHQGHEAISKALLDYKATFKKRWEYESSDIVKLRKGENFELGVYRSGKTELQSIIGWKEENGWKKEIEIIFESEKIREDGLSKVDSMRTKWVNLSNSHNPKGITEQVCSESAIYFNQGKTWVGAEINNAYSYMNDQSWSITLESIKTVQVSDDVILDIGIYRSGGRGLYVLVWGKEPEGWRVLLDFNF